MESPTIWRLVYDLAWIKLLLWVAREGIVGEPRPEVHACLCGLYQQLADRFGARGRKRIAAYFLRRAEEREGGFEPEPPPAAAMGMPAPRSFVSIDARGAPLRGRRSKGGGAVVSSPAERSER
jgi:hypothetical protein